ncbi:tRNA dihydrouridine(20/20a) synthase DusA [Motiliproteus coralliicola]|uniref:tRNA-dihydrouridine(20/20a) synthase n=1 Tax=Motiliproteus coralliicola TaxID=2283196 RepID=A0A369WD26_9GAMM|nr:tRNA dihydrouridine(20/20a) synthase DusA [Motiliproteus coralliicola]RDE19537.1 tRNA dihydrouridine(20/20a) synthase DusA [Motiliproteus coralliicola]
MTASNTTTEPNRRFSVAPMLDWTDRHCRYFHRLLSQHALLYTEMVTTGAILHGGAERFLLFNEAEHPLALQLGGSDPQALAECARLAEQWGYDEINLNVGCPSDRVQNGMFGACLMADPQLVAQCVTAMKAVTSVPVTVKHRIGIDDQDSYEFLRRFIEPVAEAGCNTFIVHARKAILKGLSPKQNREIPPLDYERVYTLKQDYPELEIIINGGIKTLEECQQHLQHLDGVMVGREAYQNPLMLAEVDQALFGGDAVELEAMLLQICDYCEQQLASGAQLGWIARHLLGLYQGQPGARRFRRYISENAFQPGADVGVLKQALALVKPDLFAA